MPSDDCGPGSESLEARGTVGMEEQRHMSSASIIQTPIKAFQSATWQCSRLGWSQVSLGDETLERREDDQKQGLQ